MKGTNKRISVFQLENDVANYLKLKMMGGKILMKKDVIPHKFTCQEGRFKAIPQRHSSQRRHQKSIAADAMMEYEKQVG